MRTKKSLFVTKQLTHLILLLLLLSSVNALTCQYDAQPTFDNNVLFNDKLFMLCSTSSSNVSYCFTYVNESNVVLQSNPEPIYVDKVGIDNKYFETKSGLVNVYYTSRNLVVGHNYTVDVLCNYGNGTSERVDYYVVPVYKNLDAVASRTVWVKYNMAYIIFIIIALIVTVFLYRMIFKRHN